MDQIDVKPSVERFETVNDFDSQPSSLPVAVQVLAASLDGPSHCSSRPAIVVRPGQSWFRKSHTTSATDSAACPPPKCSMVVHPCPIPEEGTANSIGIGICQNVPSSFQGLRPLGRISHGRTRHTVEERFFLHPSRIGDYMRHSRSRPQSRDNPLVRYNGARLEQKSLPAPGLLECADAAAGSPAAPARQGSQ